MKKLLLSALLFLSIAPTEAQTLNCTQFCLLGIAIDTVNDELDVTIYNGDSNQVNYPTVIVTDAAGDTVGNINSMFYLFAQMPGDTVTHTIPTTLGNLPAGFTGMVYLTDQIWDITCGFAYPMNCTVGVPERVTSNSISVYPNPATDNFTVKTPSAKGSLLSIYDVTGKVVRTYSANSNQLIINRNGLQSGLYFITVVADGRKYTGKLVIR
ncbi:MAG TPA: T9SS type A sorting domain-containing protein [Bacteroidia bacterium]|jgi:hypothetical protein